MAALAVVLACDAVPVPVALSGFGSATMVVIGCLLVVAEGVRRSGLIARVLTRILAETARPSALLGRLLPLLLAQAQCSTIHRWSPCLSVTYAVTLNASALIPVGLIPVSYAAILGGTDLIGTSTNLMIAGLAVEAGLERPSLVFHHARGAANGGSVD